MGEARKMIFPVRELPAADSEKGSVTVVDEVVTSPLDYASGEAEFRALMGGGGGESAAAKEAHQAYRKAIATSVLRCRLASTVDVEKSVTDQNDDHMLKLSVGTFFTLNEGDRLRFGDRMVTVSKHAPIGSTAIAVSMLTSPVSGVGFLQDSTGSDAAGFAWKPEYTEAMPESQLIQMEEFFNKERMAPPEGEPELESTAERQPVYDKPEDAVGNSQNSLPQSSDRTPQSGQGFANQSAA